MIKNTLQFIIVASLAVVSQQTCEAVPEMMSVSIECPHAHVPHAGHVTRTNVIMVTLPTIMVKVSKRNRRSMRRVCTSIIVPARETGCSKRMQARCEREAVMFRGERPVQTVGLEPCLKL